MSYQPSEIADLILLVALGPVIVRAVRRLRPSSPSAAAWALGAMLGGYVLTVAETFVLPDILNMLEHICYAVAGISFVLMVLQSPRALGPSKGGGR